MFQKHDSYYYAQVSNKPHISGNGKYLAFIENQSTVNKQFYTNIWIASMQNKTQKKIISVYDNYLWIIGWMNN